MPPAPGWFSTTTGACSAFDNAGSAARVIVSTPDAVATGRMNLTARSPSCACAGAMAASATKPSTAATIRVMRSSLSVDSGDCVLRDQLVDLGLFIAEPAQQIARVLAHPRRIEAHAEPLSPERDREQRRLHRLARVLS